MADGYKISPFPKSISLLSLTSSNLYNRRMAHSKENMITTCYNSNNTFSDTQTCDYEELVWTTVEKPPSPCRNYKNYYGNDTKIKKCLDKTGYNLLFDVILKYLFIHLFYKIEVLSSNY